MQRCQIVIADVVDTVVGQPLVLRPLDDGVIERAGKNLRKDCQYVDMHHGCVLKFCIIRQM